MSDDNQVIEGAKNRVLKCMDEAMDQMGSGVKTKVYFHALKEYKLERSQIVSKPLTFDFILGRLFGKASDTIRELITNHLRARFNPPYQRSRTLPDTIKESYKVALSLQRGVGLLASPAQLLQVDRHSPHQW